MKAQFIFIICCFCLNISMAQLDIASLEYFFDQDPGVGLATTIDINPDAEIVDQNFNISTSGLSEGTHRLFIRVIDTDGYYSLMEHKTFRVVPSLENNSSDIVEAEYFFNSDPGVGLANVIDLTDAAIIDETLIVSTIGLSEGTHRLYVRVKNSNNQWSLYEHKTFRVSSSAENNTSDIVEAEYFFNQDPGVGLANSIDLTDSEIIDETLIVSTVGLSEGTHRLYVRVKNNNDTWSLYEHKTFRVAGIQDLNAASITDAEYFIDIDPGFGNATTLSVSGDILNENLIIPTSVSLAQGDHYLYIRVKNADGTWSLYDRQLFEIDGTLGMTNEILSEFKIYPNPTSDYIKITTSNDTVLESVTIIDTYGKVILQLHDQLKLIDLSQLNRGVYLIQIHTEKGKLSKRIVKK